MDQPCIPAAVAQMRRRILDVNSSGVSTYMLPCTVVDPHTKHFRSVTAPPRQDQSVHQGGSFKIQVGCNNLTLANRLALVQLATHRPSIHCQHDLGDARRCQAQQEVQSLKHKLDMVKMSPCRLLAYCTVQPQLQLAMRRHASRCASM
jgi:hypothetical protein